MLKVLVIASCSLLFIAVTATLFRDCGKVMFFKKIFRYCVDYTETKIL